MYIKLRNCFITGIAKLLDGLLEKFIILWILMMMRYKVQMWTQLKIQRIIVYFGTTTNNAVKLGFHLSIGFPYEHENEALLSVVSTCECDLEYCASVDSIWMPHS